MIYITQLIYVKKGQELVFQEFENNVLPLMESFGGKIVQRLRPEASSFVSGEPEKPYEIHIVSFDSEEQLKQYVQDDARLKYVHLKNESVESILMFKGQKM